MEEIFRAINYHGGSATTDQILHFVQDQLGWSDVGPLVAEIFVPLQTLCAQKKLRCCTEIHPDQEKMKRTFARSNKATNGS